MTTEFTNTKYESLSFRDHVRKRSGMYIGSLQEVENNIWIINKKTNQLEKKY